MSGPEPKPGGAFPIKELSGRIAKYDIIRPIGKGAMGMVYLAHDTVLERDVALKVMVSQIADDPELNQRFIREAKAVAKMTHPNVVNVYDLGHHTDGSPFIAMELLKGQDLQKAIRTPPPMLLDRKVAIIVQVLAGLAHAHQQGIVHRDIKPANIFLNHDGTVKIMDFGVARLTTASMTGTGNIVGTADYMSPEQVKGAKVDGRSDLFSVGCMLYELMAGRRPFHSDNLMAIFYKITHEEPNFGLIPKGADFEALMPVLRKSLAKDLEGRYQTAYEFAVDLREYLKGHASTSAQHALEGLLEMEAPSTAGPQAAVTTDTPGPTIVTGEDTERPVSTLGGAGPTAPRGSSASPTVRPGTAAVASTMMNAKAASAPTVLGYEAQQAPRPRREAQVPRVPVAPQPAAGPGAILYVALGAMGVGLAALAAYVILKPDKPAVIQRVVERPPTPSTVTTMPPPSPVTIPSPPPSAAPPPSFAPTLGKGAIYMKAAQAAFKEGDYDRAISQAQKALQEDSGNSEAKRMVDNALQGQKAEARFQAAEAALQKNDFARALAEAEAGRGHAPWDGRAPQLIARIQRQQQLAEVNAQEQAERDRRAGAAAQVRSLIGQADKALSEAKYDAAIGLYEEALKLDPTNQTANLGRTSAVGARAVSNAAQNVGGGGARPSQGRFTLGKTSASSAETKAAGAGAPGFDLTGGIEVKQGSAAAALPGRINFDIDPEHVKPGERYTVKVYMVNEGTAPISLAGMVVNTKINGRGVSAPVPPQAKDVAPQQRALILSTTELWKEDTTSWSMEVVVRTARNERYSNTVTWK